VATLASNRYVKFNCIGEPLLFICYNKGMKAIPREAQVTATNSKAIRILRESLTLSRTQREVVIGSLLGDGCLVANSWGKNYRLKMQQCDKQKEYLFWKYKILKEFVLSPPTYQKHTKSWQFRTISHPEFTKLRNEFYPDGRKVIPDAINDVLKSPLSIAIWYMDDGALHTRKDTFILNTQSFSREDNGKLQKCLKDNFNISANLNRDKVYWRIYVQKNSAKHFENMVKEHIAALMSEKLLVAP